MTKPINLTGRTFGKLTVVKRSNDRVCKNGRRYIMWECLCECGNIKIAQTSDLTRKKYPTISCGCHRVIDLTNKKIGRWTVIKRNDRITKSGVRETAWLCRCECGTEKTVSTHSLKRGMSKSCGCLQKETVTNMLYKHGLTRRGKHHPIVRILHGIIGRCQNENNSGYKYYGGRGIKVCREWQKNPKKFIEWALKNGWSKGKEIDRINNDGDYTPENCRITTHLKNMQNTRLLQKNNTSRFCGVGTYGTKGKFRYEISHNNKTYCEHEFQTADEAAFARDALIVKNKWNRKLNFTLEEVQAYIDSKKVA